MTKQEAIEFLSNTKVYVDGKSKEIQEKLFELGWKWIEPWSGEVVDITKPFLFISNDKQITYSTNMTHFTKSALREIKADDILNIKIIIDYILKPFDKVLVRDWDTEHWKIELFEKYDETEKDYPYVCLNFRYRQCIPFEGNEHLLWTTNKPE